MGILSARTRRDSDVGQFNYGLLLKPPGRYQIFRSVEVDLGSAQLLPAPKHQPESLSLTRETERVRRCSLERRVRSEGMVPVTEVGKSSLPTLRQTPDRPLCQLGEQQTSNLLLQVLPTPGGGDGCSSNLLEQPVNLRLPSIQFDPDYSSEVPPIQREHDSNRPVLAEPTVISNHPEVSSRSSFQISD